MQVPTIQKVANILGLKLYEYFKLKGYSSIFYLSDLGLESFSEEEQDGLPEILEKILLDCYTIEKLGWSPDVGKIYFVPDIICEGKTRRSVWLNFPTPYECIALERGLLCKTEEEAQELADIMLEAVKKHRDRKQCERKDEAK